MADLDPWNAFVLAAIAYLLTNKTQLGKVRDVHSSAPEIDQHQTSFDFSEESSFMPERKRKERIKAVEQRGDTQIEVVEHVEGYQNFLIDASSRVYQVIACDESSRVVMSGLTYRRAYAKARDYSLLGYRGEVVHRPTGTLVIALQKRPA